MFTPSPLVRIIGALSLSLLFSACGSGGGSDAPATGGGSTGPSTSTPTTAPLATETPAAGSGGDTGIGSTGTTVVPEGTLQTTIPDATYPAGSVGLSAFEALNIARRNAGAGPLAQSAQIDAAAAAHGRYVTTNLAAVGLAHIEDPARPDYDEVTPGTRMDKAGYLAGAWTELMGSTGSSRQGADCIRNQLNAVYHAAGLLRNVTDVGFGFGTDALGYPLCVIKMAAKRGGTLQIPASGAIVAYPYNGQTNVLDTFFVGLETPRAPVSLFPNLTAGTPVVVNVRNADYVNLQTAGTLNPTVTQFTLKDAGGNLVPAGILAAPGLRSGSGVAMTSDANLLEGYVALVPFSPLTKGVTYQVSFAATLGSGATALSRTWSFTTNP